jgi:hypothetical protein
MEMKPHGKLLGRNLLTDAPYQNPGMVSNGQWSDKSLKDGVVDIKRQEDRLF